MSCGVSSRATSPPAPGVTAPSISGMRNLTNCGKGGRAAMRVGPRPHRRLPLPPLGGCGGRSTERGIIRVVPGRSIDSKNGWAGAALPPQPVPEGRHLGEEALRLGAGAAALAGFRLELLQQLALLGREV